VDIADPQTPKTGICNKKSRQQPSSTGEERWGWQCKTEMVGVKWSVACIPQGISKAQWSCITDSAV